MFFIIFSFPDEAVRETATQLINDMSDDDLCRIMPQLAQALRHETYEASPVAGKTSFIYKCFIYKRGFDLSPKAGKRFCDTPS